MLIVCVFTGLTAWQWVVSKLVFSKIFTAFCITQVILLEEEEGEEEEEEEEEEEHS